MTPDGLIVILVLIVAGFLVWRYFLSRDARGCAIILILMVFAVIIVGLAILF